MYATCKLLQHDQFVYFFSLSQGGSGRFELTVGPKQTMGKTVSIIYGFNVCSCILIKFKGVETKVIVTAFFSDCFVGAQQTIIYYTAHVTYKCFGSMRHFFKEHSLVHCKGPIRTFTDSNLECNTDCMDCGGWGGVGVGCKKQSNSF